MSRAAAGRAGLGIGGLVVAVLTAATLAHAAPPRREGCSWHRHSKHVVKHVRRHGRVRAHRRTKHWWTCDPLSVAPVLPAPENPLEVPPVVVPHLGVKAEEWSYTLSHPELTAGEVIVELNNQGQDSHNLKLQREGSDEPPLVVPEAAATHQTSAHLTLAPGTYHLYCSLFEHEEKGMQATLVVSGG